MHVTKGAQIRSQSKWITESDQNFKFFKNLENKQQINNKIAGVLDKNRILKNERKDMIGVTRDFYKNLFKSKHIDNHSIDNYLDQVFLPKSISSDYCKVCDADITEEELLNDINSNVKINKSPGCDA